MHAYKAAARYWAIPVHTHYTLIAWAEAFRNNFHACIDCVSPESLDKFVETCFFYLIYVV